MAAAQNEGFQYFYTKYCNFIEFLKTKVSPEGKAIVKKVFVPELDKLLALPCQISCIPFVQSIREARDVAQKPELEKLRAWVENYYATKVVDLTTLYDLVDTETLTKEEWDIIKREDYQEVIVTVLRYLHLFLDPDVIPKVN
jgi:hypothetical protein